MILGQKSRKKMAKGITQLVVSNPFYANIILYLHVVEDNSCPTMWTDTVSLGYNPVFVNKLTMGELIAVLCHEVLHIAFLHAHRRNNRDMGKWQHATDYAVNLIVSKTEHLPKGALLDCKYEGMTAEQIYNLLPDGKKNKTPSIGEVRDANGKGKPNAGGGSKRSESEWKIIVKKALSMGVSQGSVSNDIVRAIGEIYKVRLPWKDILGRFLIEKGYNDYTWTVPNKRYMNTGVYLPSPVTPELGKMVVVIDTSGSVYQKQLNVFASEIMGILQVYPHIMEITVIYADCKVVHAEEVDRYDVKLKPKGGGGTDYRPTFKYIEENDIYPIAVLYFTDGECNRFPEPPEYEVLWIQPKQTKFNPPFGEVIWMEEK